MQTRGIVRRQAAERRRDTLERLVTERDVWVSTAHPDHGPHQVPLWFLWDGRAVWMCTSATSATARNVREEPRVLLALPDTFDVVLLQGEAECFPEQDVPGDAAEDFAAKFGWDPRAEEDSFLYVRVVPNSVRAWRGELELRGRVIMRDGMWLEKRPSLTLSRSRSAERALGCQGSPSVLTTDVRSSITRRREISDHRVLQIQAGHPGLRTWPGLVWSGR